MEVYYSHFTFKARNISEAIGRIQLKFETKEDWPIQYIKLAEPKWIEIGPLELNLMADADWERLERITIAVYDRDIEIEKDIVFDVADFSFF